MVFLLIEIQVIVPIPRYGTDVKESLNKIKIKSQNSNTTLFIGRKLLFILILLKANTIMISSLAIVFKHIFVKSVHKGVLYHLNPVFV